LLFDKPICDLSLRQALRPSRLRYRIFKNARTLAGNGCDASENIHFRRRKTANIFENQLFIFSLNGKCRNYAVVRLPEIIDAQIKIKRIIINSSRICRLLNACKSLNFTCGGLCKSVMTRSLSNG
jgi:hypothetical protein